MEVVQPTISSDDVDEYVDDAESIIADSRQLDESDTQIQLVLPFLWDVLGWDRSDVTSEYNVQVGGQVYNADFALKVNNVVEVFVETKGLDTELNDSHVDQLQSYMKLQDVKLGLLTNGQEFRIYQLDVQDGEAKLLRVAEISLNELQNHRQSLSVISKQALSDGSIDIEVVRKLNETRRALQSRKSQIAQKVAETVVDETTDVIYQEAEMASKEMVDSLSRELQTKTSTSDDVETDSPDGDDEPTGSGSPEFPIIALDSFGGDDDARVGLYPSNERGIDFLSQFKSWGFISIATTPDYFAIYVTKPDQHVRYFGVVEELIPAPKFADTHGIEDQYEYEENKMVVNFSELYELENPIPLGQKAVRLQGLLYTTLGQLKTAQSTDDL